jgi:hypothetical protein
VTGPGLSEKDSRVDNPQNEYMQIGLASADITPAELLPMGGYIARTDPATATHDPLYAKAVLFRSGNAAALLLVVDVLYVSHEWAGKLKTDIAREIGLPPKHILMAATHTHSGPAVFSPLAGRTESMQRYEDDLVATCLEIAGKASSSAVPSRMRVWSGPLEEVAANRRDPHAEAHSLLSVVCIETPHGEVRGFLASFSCHPTVMGSSNLLYSADLFGASAAAVKEKFPESLCLMISGTSADMSTRFIRREQTWAEVDRLGGILGKQITDACNSSAFVDGSRIVGMSETLKFPYREIPSPESARREYQEAVAAFDNNADGADTAEALLARAALDGAQAQLLLSRIGGWELLFGAETAELEVQVIRVGDIIFCALPGEFFAVRGRELVEMARPCFGFVVGYANGYCGYLVPPGEANRGGYEMMMSPLDSESEQEIIRTAQNLISRISK